MPVSLLPLSPDAGTHAPQPTARERREETDRLLLELATTTDELTRARLQEQVTRLNLDIVDSVVSRYRNRGADRDDLVQVASLGLVKAIRGFDPTAGFAFLSYAVPTIRGEVQRYFRDQGWAVRPPRPIQELQARIATARNRLTHDLGRDPRPSEIATHLEVDLDDVIEAMSADGCFTPSSLDEPTYADGAPLGESLSTDDRLDLAAVDARVVLAPVLRDLPTRDRTVLYLRFFEGLTQREIGERIGVTQMHVSRILARVLRDLREQLSDPADAPVAEESAAAAS